MPANGAGGVSSGTNESLIQPTAEVFDETVQRLEAQIRELRPLVTELRSLIIELQLTAVDHVGLTAELQDFVAKIELDFDLIEGAQER